VEWYATAFELIDFRSFSNLWFWIMLALFWSTASHFVLGVPFDLVARASRNGGQAEQDMLDLVRINANRLIYIADLAGTWLTGFIFAAVSSLFLTGFIYGVEFCQALTLLFVPAVIVLWLSIWRARRIQGQSFEDTRQALRNQRFIVQVIGMISILITSMWGMFFNLTVGVLGS